MKRQIVKMNVNGVIYTVIRDMESSVQYNPLSVYKQWTEYRDGTYPLKHKKLLSKYADLTSCMCCIMSDLHHKGMVIVSEEAFTKSAI